MCKHYKSLSKFVVVLIVLPLHYVSRPDLFLSMNLALLGSKIYLGNARQRVLELCGDEQLSLRSSSPDWLQVSLSLSHFFQPEAPFSAQRVEELPQAAVPSSH